MKFERVLSSVLCFLVICEPLSAAPSSLPRQSPLKTVLIIQDLHLHTEAQTSIAAVIDKLARHLNSKHQRLLVGMEGADIPSVDFSAYNAYPHRRALRKTALALLKANLINGTEYAAIGYAGEREEGSVTLPFSVTGVENWDEYQANVKAIRDAAPLRKEMEQALADLQRMLAGLKIEHYTPDLRRFDAARARYERGELGVPAYAAYLNSVVPATEKNISKLIALSALKNSTEFEKEARSINRSVLLTEIKSLEEKVQAALSQTAEQKETLSLQSDVYLLKKLCGHALTAEDWRAYELRGQKIGALRERIASLGARAPSSLDRLESRLSVFEDFYRLALRRSDTMAARMVSRLDELSIDTGVLVAGGFHTPGLVRALKEKGVTVLTMTPSVTKISNGALSSVGILETGRRPLEQIFAGERLFTPLAAETALPTAPVLATLATTATDVMRDPKRRPIVTAIPNLGELTVGPSKPAGEKSGLTVVMETNEVLEARMDRMLETMKANSAAEAGLPWVKDPAKMELIRGTFHRSELPDGTVKFTGIETDIFYTLVRDIPAAFRAYMRGIIEKWMRLVSPNHHYVIDPEAYHVNLVPMQVLAKNEQEGQGFFGTHDQRLTNEQILAIYQDLLEIVEATDPFTLYPVGLRAGPDGAVIFTFKFSPPVIAFRRKLMESLRRHAPQYREINPKALKHMTGSRALEQFTPGKDQAKDMNDFFTAFADASESAPSIPVESVAFAQELIWNAVPSFHTDLALGKRNSGALAQLQRFLGVSYFNNSPIVELLRLIVAGKRVGPLIEALAGYERELQNGFPIPMNMVLAIKRMMKILDNLNDPKDIGKTATALLPYFSSTLDVVDLFMKQAGMTEEWGVPANVEKAFDAVLGIFNNVALGLVRWRGGPDNLAFVIGEDLHWTDKTERRITAEGKTESFKARIENAGMRLSDEDAELERLHGFAAKEAARVLERNFPGFSHAAVVAQGIGSEAEWPQDPLFIPPLTPESKAGALAAISHERAKSRFHNVATPGGERIRPEEIFEREQKALANRRQAEQTLLDALIPNPNTRVVLHHKIGLSVSLIGEKLQLDGISGVRSLHQFQVNRDPLAVVAGNAHLVWREKTSVYEEAAVREASTLAIFDQRHSMADFVDEALRKKKTKDGLYAMGFLGTRAEFNALFGAYLAFLEAQGPAGADEGGRARTVWNEIHSKLITLEDPALRPQAIGAEGVYRLEKATIDYFIEGYRQKMGVNDSPRVVVISDGRHFQAESGLRGLVNILYNVSLIQHVGETLRPFILAAREA